MASFTAFFRDKFNLFFWLTCLVTGIIIVLRCYFVPIAHDEVATFFYYVQSEKFLPFLSHIDANGHFLNSFLAWIAYKLFGSSYFVLRLPCIFAFFILCFALYKFNTKILQNIFPKFIFASAFLLSFNILNFYSLARGYGLSISFLLLALYYFFSYIRLFRFPDLIKFIVSSQLALSANLTLVFTLLVLTTIIIVFQVKNKRFLSTYNFFLLAVQFGLVLFWIKYAFYLQENGALYYGGSGEGYWKVTFVSLIETVIGISPVFNFFVVALFAALLIVFLFQLVKKHFDFLFNSNFSISFFSLCALIIAFYLLNKLFGVNFPEDRTGLFFYILFTLSIVFVIDENVPLKTFYAFFIIPAYFILHFALNINFGKHAWKFYEAMPKTFYDKLTEEQKKESQLITVGGHRVLEFFYTFYNYNSPTKLNHMTPPEFMTMNCDYYVTWKKDKPWYDKYYDEILSAKYWDMVLLKRKQKTDRDLKIETGSKAFSGEDEFFPFFEKPDTLFSLKNSIMAEFDISFKEVPKPLNAWLVLQVDSVLGKTAYFRRTALNWMKYDWNGTEHYKTCIVTDNIPLTRCRLVAFLWNIDKKPIKATLHSFKLYTLRGEGITEISQAKD